MPSFALPQAVSPRVAATLSRFAHYPVLDRVCQRASTYDITPMAQPLPRARPQGFPEQLTLIFDGRDRSKPTQLMRRSTARFSARTLAEVAMRVPTAAAGFWSCAKPLLSASHR